MSDFVHNLAKGRFAEWAERSRTGDDANGALVIIPWNTTATDATLRDLDTVAAIEADANTAERTANGWNRKTIADGSITVTIDDTNDRVDVDVADQTWTAVTADAVTDIGVAWDKDTTAGTDSNILPGTWHDFSLTPDGSDITATIAVLYRAS